MTSYKCILHLVKQTRAESVFLYLQQRDIVSMWCKIFSIFASDMFPFNVHCKVRVEQYGWHDDLLIPGTARHNALANDIISNVSGLKIRTKRFCHNAVLLFECLEGVST